MCLKVSHLQTSSSELYLKKKLLARKTSKNKQMGLNKKFYTIKDSTKTKDNLIIGKKHFHISHLTRILYPKYTNF